MISFDRVSFSYEKGTPILKDISLSISSGEFLCILGANGSGKSTLAKHLNALLFCDEGTLTCDGITLSQDITAPELFAIRKMVGMVFQNPDNQIVSSVVEEDVAFGPENLGIKNPELRTRVDNALKQVGLESLAKRSTSALSGGQKQRLALAGVLALEPKVLIFDEASAMLDPQGRKEFMNLCTDLHRKGFTIIMTTHFMEEAAFASRIIVLEDGRIVAQGTPEELFSDGELVTALNLDIPFSVRVSRALQDRGIDIPLTFTTDALKEGISCLASRK
ncbi:MAG: energy-coupling factor transporter ATPase [Anaerotardibacter sp.]